MKSQAVGTSVGSVVVNGIFDSRFDNYKIIYSNFTTSIENIEVRCRLKDDTTTDSTTNYYWAGWYSRYTSATGGFDRAAGATYWSVGSGAGTASFASFDVSAPNLSTYTTYTAQPSANSSTDAYVLQRAGVMRTTTQYTGVRILPSGGTMSGGIIRVYGYNNG